MAQGLHGAGLATLLLGLLTLEDAMADQQTHRWRFDIPLLGHRLTGAVDWLIQEGLRQVRCSTLLIVGGMIATFWLSTQQAIAAMTAPHRLSVVPGASHLFAEAGALETVTTLAKEWFRKHLRMHPSKTMDTPPPAPHP